MVLLSTGHPQQIHHVNSCHCGTLCHCLAQIITLKAFVSFSTKLTLKTKNYCMYLDFSLRETCTLIFLPVKPDFCSWSFIYFYIFPRENFCMLIYCFVKHNLSWYVFVKLVACWFFLRDTWCMLIFVHETCCMWIISSSNLLFLDLSLQDTYFLFYLNENCCMFIFLLWNLQTDFSPRESVYLLGTFCVLSFVRET